MYYRTKEYQFTYDTACLDLVCHGLMIELFQLCKLVLLPVNLLPSPFYLIHIERTMVIGMLKTTSSQTKPTQKLIES